MIPALLAAALLAADPCAIPPPLPADASTARVYQEVGESELAHGQVRSARIALAEALRRDPKNRALLEKYRRVCRMSGDPFARGLRLMHQGALRAAISAFERARAGPEGASATLLAGICHYQLGEDGPARSLLEKSARDSSLRSSARLFLGLIALRNGHEAEAATQLSAVREDPALGAVALELSDLARKQGRLMLSVLGESGYDSNVALLPDGSVTPGGAGDARFELAARFLARPLGPSGPFFRVGGILDRELTYSDYDLTGAAGALGYQLGSGGDFLLAEYQYAYRLLGGGPYLSAHRLLAQGQLEAGHLLLSAFYVAHLRSFLDPSVNDYSGALQRAGAGLGWRFGRAVVTRVGALAGRDGARSADLSWREVGPRLTFQFRLGPRVRARLDGRMLWRSYDAVDPTLGTARLDRILRVGALGEVDLDAHWTLRLGAELRRSDSSIPDFTYTELLASIGIHYAVGFF